MPINRREFIAAAAAVATGAALAPGADSQPPRKFEAVAFDAFVLFDVRSVFAIAKQLFPERGDDLCKTWLTRQFEYSWLRVITRRYADFFKVTEDALAYAAMANKVELSSAQREQIMSGYATIKPWPDAVEGLKKLRTAGLRLAFLSNMTPAMLSSACKSASIDDLFEAKISTDAIKTYKPDPAAYQFGIDTLKLPKERILFAAFGGWDAAGAKSFGYTTYWANRLALPVEQLDVTIDRIGGGMKELVEFVAT
jgi:2-haloacid dehalogenase